MRRLAVLLVLALLVPLSASADVATATWTHPTQYEDGTALPLASIGSTKIEWGTCSGSLFAVKEGEKVVPAPATTTTVTISRFGPTCLRAFTTTVGGTVSGPSGVVVRTLVEPNPKPPVLTVSNPTAYEFRNGSLRVAGIVQLGTVCGEEVARGYYKVPESAVNRTTNFRLKGQLVAQCTAT